MQKDLAAISSPDSQAGLLEKARILGAIVQLLVFDLFVGKSADWNTYLTPAITLFEDILRQSSTSLPTKPGFMGVLTQMAWPSPSFAGFEGRPIWNTDQAAFRFFTAILLFLDIVSSTSLERAPRLCSHHSRILAGVAPDEVADPLDLSAFVGAQNWALLAVGKAAALDEWKKRMMRAGQLSRLELRERTNNIFQALEQGLASLDIHRAQHADIDNVIVRLQPYYHTNL